jgi:ferrous iron transport protein B
MSAAASSTATAPLRVGLVGPPNSGKTSLFIRLTGLHAKTGNFSGTTLERQAGTVQPGALQQRRAGHRQERAQLLG